MLRYGLTSYRGQGMAPNMQAVMLTPAKGKMDALRKKFESQVLTTEDREAKISELLSTQRDLEAELVQSRSKAAKAERARRGPGTSITDGLRGGGGRCMRLAVVRRRR